MGGIIWGLPEVTGLHVDGNKGENERDCGEKRESDVLGEACL